MPEDSATPGAIFCVGAAALVIDGSDYGFVLGELGYVGVCPGPTSVSSSVTSCL